MSLCEERFEDTEEIEGESSCDDRGRDWSCAGTSQGMSRTSSRYQKIEEARKETSLETSMGARPADTLILYF